MYTMLNSLIRLIMLGKEAIVRFFRERKSGPIFYLPGIHTLPLNEAFKKGNINAVMGRHESNCAFMADGYARATGDPGTVIVTPGPGLGNVVSPCMEAFGDDIPLVILHVDTDRNETGRGTLHEVKEPETIFTHLTKRALVVRGRADLVPFLDEAYAVAAAHRPGPVLLSIPYTFFEKEVPYERVAKKTEETVVDLSPLEEVLKGKERPVIIGGRHLIHADIRDLLTDLCSTSSIPLLSSTGGKGAVREDQAFCFGSIMKKGINRAILSSADIVIALGTRLRDTDATGRGVKLKTLAHVDIDDQWIGKNYPTPLSLAADMKKTVEYLAELFRGKKTAWDMESLHAARKTEEADLESGSAGFRIISMLRTVIPEDTITAWDLNGPGYWAEYYFPVLEQRTFLRPGGISTIFYAVPAAIGAKAGRQDRPCLCVIGDGGALPGLAELATVKAHNIPVVFLVCNNGSFGILEDYMRKRYAIKDYMSLVNPDYVRLASAFDIKGVRVDSLEALREVFLRRITWDEPFLIDFVCPSINPPWEL